MVTAFVTAIRNQRELRYRRNGRPIGEKLKSLRSLRFQSSTPTPVPDDFKLPRSARLRRLLIQRLEQHPLSGIGWPFAGAE